MIIIIISSINGIELKLLKVWPLLFQIKLRIAVHLVTMEFISSLTGTKARMDLQSTIESGFYSNSINDPTLINFNNNVRIVESYYR